MKNKKKLALLLTSLMTFSGCEIYYVNSSNPEVSSSTTSSTVVESSSETSTSSEESSSDSSSSSEESSSTAPAPTVATVVTSISSKQTLVDFELNKGVKEEKTNEFVIRDRYYQVGDDNRFNFKPQISVMKMTSNGGSIETETLHNVEWTYNINLALYENNGYTALPGENDYVTSIDYTNCDIDFSDAAIGKRFQISIYPKNLTDKQLQELETKYTRSYEVEVVDGYNVYEAKELGYITNANSIYYGHEKTNWDTFKTENNLLLDYYPSALILHDDIKITAADLPKEYFYSAAELNETDSDYNSALGSLRDWLCVYNRNLSGDDSFTLEGNYFDINAEYVPTVVRTDHVITDPSHIVSHSQLFYFYSKVGNNVNIQNVRLNGNAQRSEEAKLGGGIIMCKKEGANFVANNVISRSWYISYISDYAHYINAASYDATLEPAMAITNCKGYDNFTSFIYNWGSKVLMNNSEFIQSGGPAILQDYVAKEKDGVNNVQHIPYTEANNCNIVSRVTGSEAWFAMHNASQEIAGLLALDYALASLKKRISIAENGNNYINLICLNKDGSAEGPAGTMNTTGTFILNNDNSKNTFDYGASNPEFYQFFWGVMQRNYTNKVLLTSTGGMCYNEGQLELKNKNNEVITTSNAGHMLTGDLLSIYYGFMQITVGYYNA